MLTGSAARSSLLTQRAVTSVCAVRDLGRGSVSRDVARGQLRAGRWQRIGNAVVLHNGPLTEEERRAAALVNLGPRAALTAFSALSGWGLQGWEREVIHVLVPHGARVRRPAELSLRIHFTDRWDAELRHDGRQLHRPAPAAVRAAGTFEAIRPACAVLAAVVQQRLARPQDLVDAVVDAPRVRHRAALLAAAHDIAQGAQALSEIDFVKLCRRANLPTPRRQSVRREPGGRRRYLDAEWDLPDGRRLVVEVDGALHMRVERWWADQLRQNLVALTGDIVLRFPSVVVRSAPDLVVSQLRPVLVG